MSRASREPLLAWSGWTHLGIAWLQTALVSAWFGFVFVGADWLTAHRMARVRVHLDVELKIPLIPSFTLIYMSLYALFIAAPFVLRTRLEISALAVAQALTIFVAGICFLFIPARLAFPTPSDSELGIWRALFRYADRLNLDYNLVPSLHVALSFVCIELFAPRAAPGGRFLLRTWGGLIGIATVLTHQHHVVDAVTGYLLAWVAVKGVGRSQHRLGQE
jgi:hypothetical protein